MNCETSTARCRPTVTAVAGGCGGAENRPASTGRWLRSSFCRGAADTCVDVAFGADHVRIRDSKSPDGPELTFTPAEWAAFVLGVCNGEFELPAVTPLG
ncbi:DUF397 domain-containing protein [Frankia sp. AgKG'84/4]|uniref:DUF397 domain-containing protein n=1 Tax=Frankia sp. AgKG'84/4 TaxID=573490 RepID=UPI0025433390|nr:DUF397 domain-containing protein [Frankia sp. AgKG'84/4]